MNKINWNVRMQSGAFWLGLVSVVATLVYTILNMAGIIPKFSYKELMDLVVLILQIPAFLGIITDPTTKGLADSTQAMGYETPKEDK